MNSLCNSHLTLLSKVSFPDQSAILGIPNLPYARQVTTASHTSNTKLKREIGVLYFPLSFITIKMMESSTTSTRIDVMQRINMIFICYAAEDAKQLLTTN